VGWMPAATPEDLSGAVGDEIDRVFEAEDRAPERILFATTRLGTRDRLRNEVGFVSWEEGDGRAIVCETVDRVKGSESDHVILVTTEDDVSDSLLCIGVSRAISGLSVMAPAALAGRVGLSG